MTHKHTGRPRHFDFFLERMTGLLFATVYHVLKRGFTVKR